MTGVVKAMQASLDEMARRQEQQERMDAEIRSAAFDFREAMQDAIEAQLRPSLGGELAFSVAIGGSPLPEGEHPQWVGKGLAALRSFERAIRIT